VPARSREPARVFCQPTDGCPAAGLGRVTRPVASCHRILDVKRTGGKRAARAQIDVVLTRCRDADRVGEPLRRFRKVVDDINRHLPLSGTTR